MSTFPNVIAFTRRIHGTEILTTFSEEVGAVTLQSSEINGQFTIYVADITVFDRKEFGGFAEIKEVKQLIRDRIAPGKNLGILTLQLSIKCKLC